MSSLENLRETLNRALNERDAAVARIDAANLIIAQLKELCEFRKVQWENVDERLAKVCEERDRLFNEADDLRRTEATLLAAPKPKRKVTHTCYLNLYTDGTWHSHRSRQAADAAFRHAECREITWEAEVDDV